jgi:hypothetical protein
MTMGSVSGSEKQNDGTGDRPSKRLYRRIPVRCFVSYLAEDFMGTGTVSDLSINGYRIEGNHPIYLDRNLTLRVFLPNDPRPLDVERAAVRWMNGLEFGLQIVRIAPEAEARLNEFVATYLARTSSISTC